MLVKTIIIHGSIYLLSRTINNESDVNFPHFPIILLLCLYYNGNSHATVFHLEAIIIGSSMSKVVFPVCCTWNEEEGAL